MHSSQLSERAKHVLKSLIDMYLTDGQPVGSKTLSNMPDMRCSPATVRNVMAELESLGLILSPHTSAGRIPTPQGLRLFVDSMLTVKPISDHVLQDLQSSLGQEHDPNRLIQSVSSLISSMTRLAGVVTTPKRNKVVLKQIEFLKLNPHKVLVILVLNTTEVENRIIMTSREFSESELTRAGNFLTKTFGRTPLEQVRTKLLSLVQKQKHQLDEMMQAVMSIAEQSFESLDASPDYILAGQNHLLGSIDDQGVDALKSLFDAFTEKREILQLFDQCMSADGVQIFIGEESGFSALKNYSLVTSPYAVDDESIGLIGVIGPTRMDYNQVVPLVDITSKILSMAIQSEQ